MIKFFLSVLVFFTTVSMSVAQEDCDCGHNPYVTFQLNEPVEFDENSWRVTGVKHFDLDLTRADEPEVCEVSVELIPSSDPILYLDFQYVPLGDIELFWQGTWILASEFSDQMDASGCDILGTMS